MKYFLLYFFLEVLVSVKISSYLGGLGTFIEIIFSAFVGMTILSNFKSILMENFKAVSHYTMDLEQFQSLNLFTFFGAILLIIPGFLTDIIGLLMQFSLVTTIIVNRFYDDKNSCDIYEKNDVKKDSDVIDVEVISSNNHIK